MLPLQVHHLLQVTQEVLQNPNFAVLQLIWELKVGLQGFLDFLGFIEPLTGFLLEQAIRLPLWVLQVFKFWDTKREELSFPLYCALQMELC